MLDTISSIIFFLRELDFIKRQEAERKKIEESEKAHLVEVQGLQARVSRVLEVTAQGDGVRGPGECLLEKMLNGCVSPRLEIWKLRCSDY